MNHMEHTTTSSAAMWSPGIFLIAIIFVSLYWYVIGPMRHRFAGSEPVNSQKRFALYTAAFLFVLSEGSPIGYYGHGQSFSMHMLQMSILYLMVPPLVYISLPDWLVRPLLQRKNVRKWLYPLTHPLLGVALFNVIFSYYHIPLIFDSAYNNMALHQIYHVGLAVLAFHMWFPVFCPLPEWNRISDLQKLAYIFANGVLLTPACALIIFASKVMYPQFTLPESWVPYMTPLDDQQLGGTIMKVLQEAVYGWALAYIFFRWYRKERKKEEAEESFPETAQTYIVEPKRIQ